MTYIVMVQDRHPHQMAIVVLSGVSFLFENLRENRSVPLNSQVLHVLNILAAHQLKIAALDHPTILQAPNTGVKPSLL